MRSPPADIFVYGVHPLTSVEDIVADLAESDVKIEVTDIFPKSKAEAFLKSFRISVKAEDLQKALNPAIWPLRVKVREYIYYSKRNLRQGEGNGQQTGSGRGGPAHQGQGAPAHQGQGAPAHQEQAGPAQQVQANSQGERGQLPGHLGGNMYAALADNVEGPHVV